MSDGSYPDFYEQQFESRVEPAVTTAYKRHAWWRVTFPVVAAAVLGVVGLVLLIVLGGPIAVSAVARYAGILLTILLGLPILLVVIALFGGLVWVMSKALEKTPPYTRKAHNFVGTVYRVTDDATDRVVDVVINARSAMSGVDTALREAGIEIDLPEEAEEPQRQI